MMSCDKLKKLVEHRDAILLAEIGALIHDLGKLSEEFIRKQSEKEKDKFKDYHHSKILDYDSGLDKKYKPKKDDTKSLAKKVKQKLKCLSEEKDGILGGTLLDIIEEHHNKEKPKNDLIKIVIASDEFDSEEDRGKAKDEQKDADKTFKATAFGIEDEGKIKINMLEEERQKVYEILLDYFNKNLNRFKLLEKLNKYFSKALGMTARAANDVTLWDHSYMTASIMKALVAYRVLDSSFIVSSKKDIIEKKPFSIFAVGWNFFDFVSQSHKIPDAIGRIRILEEIKNSIRKIMEEEYALGNSIYEDDFGIYFLIPSVLSDDDLKEVKERIFDVFNEKIKGLLLPVFHLEETNSKEEFRIGKLLSGAIAKIKEKIRKHEVNLIKTPAWINRWRSSVELPKEKLVCNVCGKGFYCRGEDEKICEICDNIRGLGRQGGYREKQTIFIDEIAWNSDKRQYENVCLLIAKFELDEWLNGELLVRSLFIRAPDIEKIQWLKDFYNSKLCKEDDGNLVLNESLIKNKLLSLGALYGYLKSRSEKAKNSAINQIKKCLEIYDNLDNFSKELLSNVEYNLKRAKKLINSNNISELQEVLSRLTPEKVINNLKTEIKKREEIVLTQNDDHKKYEKQIIKSARDLKEVLYRLFQKIPSSSRLMRIWNNTKEFFEEVAKSICLSVPVISECKVVLKDEIDNLTPNMAYLLEIENNIVGEVISLEEKSRDFFVITPHTNDYLLKNKGELRGKKIVLRHPDSKEQKGKGKIKEIVENGRTVRAYRIISISPMLFMAIIPASKSMGIVKMIKEKYLEHFGKVFGKLPLHVGLIYFKRKMPIFAVLDSAMRMINEFESLKDEDGLHVVENPRTEDNYMILELNSTKKEQKPSKYKAKIPYKLGDGGLDYYHPYLIVENPSDDVIEIKINGNSIVQKHISKIKKDDIIKMKKYYLDFEFLDSNIRRFDIGAKRKHWLFVDSTNRPKPYLLWDIDNFERLRKLIQKLGLTTTQIMNLYEMLIAKIEEWGIRRPLIELLNSKKEDKEKVQVFEKLVENTIKDAPLRLEVVNGDTKKGKISKEDYEFLKESILNGMFFDFVDLWHTILKFEFEKGGENGSI